jgi:hypothetical protein
VRESVRLRQEKTCPERSEGRTPLAGKARGKAEGLAPPQHTAAPERDSDPALFIDVLSMGERWPPLLSDPNSRRGSDR